MTKCKTCQDREATTGTKQCKKCWRKDYIKKNHEHINKIENQKIKGFHIHKATQRYQEMGFREEGYAETSKRYVDWRTALNSMLADNNFLVEVEKTQKRLS